ncbi:EthD domain-containing protein [Aspergillus ibericus CBS 121593]|uniref:EthD domain-containing protein n=1 Tax=Aspergillus ibericus CBS 121593 TaxID=1448316 RepID=A0A395GHQ3_9EURO|nr:hypothetical protein BO80DRAFT_430375 [Aspergillus ibericus CBS 121593]RAK94844.1 hypothetical protein BO80DRAFT_430375 [Aspergillus ibericus CBS 121593]
MPLTLLAYLYRKPGTTPAYFKDYYEHHHLPMVKQMTGASFPTRHKRYYLPRTPNNAGSMDLTNAYYAPTVLAGKPDDFPWDVYVEMVFQDRQHFQAFRDGLDAQGERVASDEMNFMDRTKVFVAEVEGPFELWA